MKYTYAQTKKDMIVILETGIIYRKITGDDSVRILMTVDGESNYSQAGAFITNTKEQSEELWGHLVWKCEFICSE